MAENIKDLIERIQQEGIKAAEDKAKEIENQARNLAESMVKKAQAQAEKRVAQAQEEIAKLQESSKIALKQASRDLLLALRKEINAMLDRLILSAVRESLSPQELAKIITALIKDYSGAEKSEITVLLNKEDLDRIEKGFLSRLREGTSKGIVLKSCEDISAGLVISYDGGRSHYDFSDAALSEYLGQYLKSKLAQLLRDAAAGDTKV